MSGRTAMVMVLVLVGKASNALIAGTFSFVWELTIFVVVFAPAEAWHIMHFVNTQSNEKAYKWQKILFRRRRWHLLHALMRGAAPTTGKHILSSDRLFWWCSMGATLPYSEVPFL